MKNKLLLLFLPMLLLTGCNKTSSGVIPTKERETVALTADNYSKYIAVYTQSDTYYDGKTYTLYRYQLEGSSLCKFIDCKLTYSFANASGTLPDYLTTYEMDLTISGCGESIELSVRQGYNGYMYFAVVSASGTVEILY